MADHIPAHFQAPHNVGTTEEPLERIEIATAIMMRNLEMLRRRSDSYADLDRSEYLLLRALEYTGPTDVATLATELGLDHSTAARQVSAMCHKDLVTRGQATTDRRRSVITPTSLGRDRLETTRDRRRHNTAELLADWSHDDLDTLATMFTRYNQAVARTFLTAPSRDQPPAGPEAGSS